MTRRVVTGQSGGRSIIVSDEDLPGVSLQHVPHFHSVDLWTVPAMPDHPAAPNFVSAQGQLPGPGRAHFLISTFPPDSVFHSPNFDVAAAGAEMAATWPGVASTFDPANPGMHTTPTVDLGLIVSGKVVLEVDDGVQTEMCAGDVIVQNGARHAWRNISDQTVTIAFVMVGTNDQS